MDSGGSSSDVEAIYAYRAGDKMSFGIVTGFDPDGVKYGGATYTPGDIFINVGTGWNVAIDLHTGEVYTGAAGTNPQIASSGPFTHVGGTGNRVGTTLLSIPFDGIKTTILSGSKSSLHYFYEGSLDVATVGGADKLAGIHWTMSCGNDVGEGWDRIVPVPEPVSFALLGIGLAWNDRPASPPPRLGVR